MPDSNWYGDLFETYHVHYVTVKAVLIFVNFRDIAHQISMLILPFQTWLYVIVTVRLGAVYSRDKWFFL